MTHRRGPAPKFPQLRDHGWLTQRYVESELSTIQIAEELGCSAALVQLQLHTFGIKARGRWSGRWEPKTCLRESCGKEYTPSGPSQMYCSPACREGTAVCERAGCDKEFTRESKGKSSRRFCSAECQELWRAENCRNRWVNSGGYIVIPNPTLSRRVNANGYVDLQIGEREGSNNGRVLEHRWIMEQRFGRRLFSHEEVHHRNGHRDDNDRCPNCPATVPPPEVHDDRLHCASCEWESTRRPNLELWTTSQPRGQRVDDKIDWAIGFLAEYGYTVTTPERASSGCPA